MKSPIFVTGLMFIILSLGCSNGSNPAIPKNPDNSYALQDTITNQAQIPLDTRGVFGVWKIRINPKEMTAEITPARNAQAIGNIFDSDLSQFLTVSPCANCLMITKIWVDSIYEDVPYKFRYRLHVVFKMRHPFESLTLRPDLHGFDVRLILMGNRFSAPTFEDIEVLHPDGSTEGAILNKEFVLNADGYTSHFDDLTMDDRYFISGSNSPENVNPFFRFFEDRTTPDFDPHAPAGYNVMPVGAGNYSRTVIFHQTMIQYEYEFYAVADVAYGQSATFQNRQDPQYYLPAFNRTEPWRVEYWIENNNLNHDDPAATAEMVVQVFDWQHSAIVDPAYPDPANPTGIPESSQVQQLELSIPSLMEDPVIVTTPESGSGQPDDPLQYRITVANERGYGHDVYTGLLAVRDELYNHASPSGRMPIPETPAGFPYETEDILDYTLYQLVYINQPNTNYGLDLFDNELYVEPASLYHYYDQRMYATFFMDPSHSQFLYQWDYDYDGSTFDIDYVGMPSEEISFPESGLNYVGLRVRTNSRPPREYTYSIPVYQNNMGYRTELITSGGTDDTTYFSRNQSLAWTDDYYYVAFTSEATGERDVWLGVGDSNFNFTTHNLTTGVVEPCYNPAIDVIEDGPYAGVYVAYTNWLAGETRLYSINGNFDGTGFDAGNIKHIYSAADVLARNPCLVEVDENLFAYFEAANTSTLESFIRIARMNTDFTAWLDEGEIDPLIPHQLNPDACFVSGYVDKMFIVFENWTDYISRGTDLYLISSEIPDDFSSSVSKNISVYQDNTDEVYPSISGFRYQLGVAYLSKTAPDRIPVTNVTMLDLAGNSSTFYHWKEYFSSGFRSTIPAISTSAEGRFILADGGQNISSESTWITFLELIPDSYVNRVHEYDICTVDLGVVPASASNAFPGIISRFLDNEYNIESFFVCRTFENGRTESASPFSMQFGNVLAMNAVTIPRDD